MGSYEDFTVEETLEKSGSDGSRNISFIWIYISVFGYNRRIMVGPSTAETCTHQVQVCMAEVQLL